MEQGRVDAHLGTGRPTSAHSNHTVTSAQGQGGDFHVRTGTRGRMPRQHRDKGETATSAQGQRAECHVSTGTRGRMTCQHRDKGQTAMSAQGQGGDSHVSTGTRGRLPYQKRETAKTAQGESGDSQDTTSRRRKDQEFISITLHSLHNGQFHQTGV